MWQFPATTSLTMVWIISSNKFESIVNKKMQELEAILKQKVATSSVELTTNAPEKKVI